MLRVLRAEITKLKRAKVFVWSVAIVVLFALLSYWTVQLGDTSDATITWDGLLTGSPMYMAGWWGILVFGMAAAHLFGAEFSDGTAETLLTTPIRRETIVTAKLLVLAGWVGVLAVVSIASHLAAAAALHASGFSWALVREASADTLQVAFMLYLTLPVIALVSMAGRGYMAPMLFSSVLLAFNLAFTFLGWAEWFPWAMPATVAGGLGPPSATIGELGAGSWAMLALTFVLGVGAVHAYVNRAGERA